MKLRNCPLNRIEQVFTDRKIVFFGCGSWLNQIECSEFDMLRDQYAYVIDNMPHSNISLSGKELQVYSPDKLKEEKECFVILTSPIYQYEMFCQLDAMELSEDIICYSFPFMQLVTENKVDETLLIKIKSGNDIKIPRQIHGFWFSGDEKSELYKKCVESWYRFLPNYEIKEWSMDNYDWHKHPFMERAIELKAWAFATDYARLDVLNEYGGIYLDMDVEVFKPFDDLLGNNTILSFTNHVLIDLAAVGSTRNNELIQRMLKVYDDLYLPDIKDGFTKYHQPSLMRRILADSGIKMNGSLQLLDDGTAVLPSDMFMPLDHVLFRDYKRDSDTYCVHYDNFGWSYSGDSKREKKITDNRKLWKLIEVENE